MSFKLLREDVCYTNSSNGTHYSVLRQWLANPGIRCVTYMRLAARGGILGKIFRNHLLLAYGCDASRGAKIGGGIVLPHPIGIVIGMGVELQGNTWIYQGVTLGANRRNEYPTISSGAKLYPGCLVSGGVRIGSGAIIGAGAHIFQDVPDGAIVRGTATPLD